jgi:sortase (surface protein transpeptidase)
LTCSAAPLAAVKAAPQPAQSAAAAIATITATPPRADPTPVRLLIPRITVDTAVEARGLDSQRNLATPLDSREVAWFNQGPVPGMAGNAILNGHVNWWTGSAVFARLGELRPGDAVIVVRVDGSRASFQVNGSRTLAATARDASLFAPAATPTLTLITCTGPWDLRLGSDTERLLVSATLV